MTEAAGQGWDPKRYGQFEVERSQPFYDLAALIKREPELRVLDLGCGTGELTAWLHNELGARKTLGVDRSSTMIERAAPRATDTLQFRQVAIEPFLDESPARSWPLVFLQRSIAVAARSSAADSQDRRDRRARRPARDPDARERGPSLAPDRP